MIPAIFAWGAVKDLLKKHVLPAGIVVGVVVGLFFAGYLKGCLDERSRWQTKELKNTKKQIKEINEATTVQEEIEAAHDKRVYKILSGPVSAADAARMLSGWPDETSDAP